jgi:hypothetical protein
LMKAHNPMASKIFCCGFHKLALAFTCPMAFCLPLS